MAWLAKKKKELLNLTGLEATEALIEGELAQGIRNLFPLETHSHEL